MVISKRELVHHETAVCEYRKVKCHNCVKIEQDVEEMKEQMKEIKELKAMMVQMFQKLGFLENAIQVASAINNASNALMQDIFITGGFHIDANDSASKSAERFSWKKNVWERMSSMSVGRVGATSLVCENQLFVAGGCKSNVIEVLNLNDSLQSKVHWGELTATLPYRCTYLRSAMYQNRAILFCACGNGDGFSELSLIPPYTCKLLCKLPEPRKSYALVAFEHKILIFGGRSTITNNLLDSVLEFDINTNELKVLRALPYAKVDMAAIRWGDQAVLIGGSDNNGQSEKVIMYDSKSGHTTVLPPMMEERSGCCAVITSNTIVVMGGRAKHPKGRLKSVVAFTLGGYSWRYLPAMNDIRSLATATVLPTKN